MENKKKCDVKTCKAACCYNVPFDKSYFSAYQKRIARPILRFETFYGGMVLPITSSNANENACPFLNERCRCNIYDVRPKVCRLYGTGERFLNCEFLTGKKIETKDVIDGLLTLKKDNEALFNRLVF